MTTSYFHQHGQKLKYTLKSDKAPKVGFRHSQRGALFAIGAHFSLSAPNVRKDPAMIVMPTGSGKTAVLMAAPFQERSNRALVITPSRIVRNQIASDFESLVTLKKLNALDEEIPTPNVKEHIGRIKTEKEWEELRGYDIVVSTPMSISPAVKGVSKPPGDLFDMILVDEAHHKPAPTWNKLLQSFSGAKRILFTATPFRADEKVINGKLIYYYSIKKAHTDGVFGDIEFIEADNYSLDKDINIAQKAYSVYRQDRDAGLNHYLIARARSIEHATKIKTIYDEHTSLDLRVIHSGHRYSRVLQSIQDLKDLKIDGVICVDMLGEGFDFPELKIAAIHAPHKSLAVTLQFVGRLARTTAENIGTAKLISRKSDIEIEDKRIFRSDTGASWLNIISGLSEAKVSGEQEIKETLGEFETVLVPSLELDDLPLYNLKPRMHVKIFRVKKPVDLAGDLLLPNNLEMHYRHNHKNKTSIVFITRESTKPTWSDLSQFTSTKYDLFVVYYDKKSNLLFINSSKKSFATYESIATSFTRGQHKTLPLHQINRVLGGLKNPEFYNIGMRSRIQHSSNESYRIMAGPRTDDALDPTDGQLYHRGHVFGAARMSGESINTGYSSGSKIWSSSTARISDLINWCKKLADLLSKDNDEIETGTKLDNIGVGEPVTHIPEHIIGIDWPRNAYTNPISVFFQSGGERKELQLLDLDFRLDSLEEKHIRLSIIGPGFEYPLKFSPFTWPHFECLKDDNKLFLSRNFRSEPFLNYLNTYHLNFYQPDFSRIEGEELYGPPEKNNKSALGEDRYQIIHWEEERVDIQREFADEEKGWLPAEGYISIHKYFKELFSTQEGLIAFYDHTTGEAADFITIEDTGNEILVQLYHCKSSNGREAGVRDKDIFDICGQAIKSLRYLGDPFYLAKHIKRRKAEVDLPDYISGNNDLLDNLIELTPEKGYRFKVSLIQPGISKEGIIGSAEKERILAGCDRMLRHSGAEGVTLIVSK